ncbi:MAG: phage portal protein [Paludibacteraceae bacterium]|nr:phage portal protein [Paludibacteraceae bacterium]
MTIEEILSGNDACTKIANLKNSKNVVVPPIEKIRKDYNPLNHDVNNEVLRPNKKRKDKPDEKVARISLGLQQLVVRRMTEFMFAIPVKRVYHGADKSDRHREAAKSIEAIFTKSHIDSENIKRAHDYFACCEIATLWYNVKKANSDYGFKSENKVRCKTYSPLNGYNLYPYFDEYGDMLAMSVEYEVIGINNKRTTYFDTWTESRHIRWQIGDGKSYDEIINEENPIGKIPYIYSNRREPIWELTNSIVNEIEMTLSRNSDVIAYNSAPLLVVKGELVNDSEAKGESRRVYQIKGDNGDIHYVSWQQAIDSIKFQIDMLLKLFWMQLQLPDISLENLRGMTASGEAMKTLLTDAHLKVGDEKGAFLELFEREGNVVKAFLKRLQPSWSSIIDEIEIEHVITPFIQNDEAAEIDKLLKLNGQKPLLSQKESIEQLGWTKDADKTLKAIRQEEADTSQQRFNVFNETAE